MNIRKQYERPYIMILEMEIEGVMALSDQNLNEKPTVGGISANGKQRDFWDE